MSKGVKSYSFLLCLMLLVAITSCENTPTSPEATLYDQLIGSWSGEKILANATGSGFDTTSGHWITFTSNDSFSSNIPPRLSDSVSGSFIVIGTSVVITVPPINNKPYAIHFEDISIVDEVLSFVTDWNPTTTGFQPNYAAYFRLRRPE